jgi:hypothetical protein
MAELFDAESLERVQAYVLRARWRTGGGAGKKRKNTSTGWTDAFIIAATAAALEGAENVRAWTHKGTRTILLVVGPAFQNKPNVLKLIASNLKRARHSMMDDGDGGEGGGSALYTCVASISDKQSRALIGSLVASGKFVHGVHDISDKVEALCAIPMEACARHHGIVPEIFLPGAEAERALNSVQRAQAGILRHDDAWVAHANVPVGAFVRLRMNLPGLEIHDVIFRVRNLEAEE